MNRYSKNEILVHLNTLNALECSILKPTIEKQAYKTSALIIRQLLDELEKSTKEEETK